MSVGRRVLLAAAVLALGAPLIVVLGHESCGAFAAAIKTTQDNTVYPGQIQKLTLTLKPVVEKVLKQPGDLLLNATVENVKDSVQTLKSASPVLSQAISVGKLKIVGGIYRLATGKVDLIAYARQLGIGGASGAFANGAASGREHGESPSRVDPSIVVELTT